MNPKYIDTHAHVHFAAYDADRADVVTRALNAETWMINVGTKLSTSKDAIALAEQYETGVYAIVGLHPIHTNASFHDKDEIGEEGEPFHSRGEQFDLDAFEELVAHPKVVGIGECGLDFFRIEGDRDVYIKNQRRAFGAQIELAITHNKPLMIHCRDAYTEVLQILASYKLEHGDALRGNFHFFAGTEAQAKQILDLGFTVSFTGVITFAKDYKPLVEFVPLERMLSETDCPYVTPVPYRGQRNEPLYVQEVVKKIAEMKGEDETETAVTLLKNAKTLFGLPLSS